MGKLYSTPAELREGATIEDQRQADEFRSYVQAKVQKSGGTRFILYPRELPSRAGAIAILTRELAADNWRMNRISDQRDGDFYDVTPIG